MTVGPNSRFRTAESYDKTIVVDTQANRLVATCEATDDAIKIAELLNDDNAKAKGES